MSTTIKTGWLKDKDGDKFAPKTYTSQVLEYGDTTLDKKLQEIDKELENIENVVKSPLKADVGQQLIVKKVDEDGKPIDWEYVERPCYVEETKKIFEDNNLILPYISSYDEMYSYEWTPSEEEQFLLDYGKLYLVETSYGNYILMCEGEGRGNILYCSELSLDIEDCTAGYGHIKITTGQHTDSFSLDIRISEIVSIKQLNKEFIPDVFIKKPYSSGTSGDVLISDGQGGAYWGKFSGYIKNTDYATSSKAGLVRTDSTYGTYMLGQYIQIYSAFQSDIDSKTSDYRPITPNRLDYAVKSGLSNNKLTWTETEKKNARNLIGAVSKDDLEVPTQSDWNEEDVNNLGYIRNRPFYYSRELVSSYDPDGNLKATLEEGKIYSVIINGELYTDLLCTKYYWYHNAGATFFLLGATDMSDTSTGGEHGFVLFANTSNTKVYAVSSDSSKFDFPTWTGKYSYGRQVTRNDKVTILSNDGVLKQIDEKFIPDSIPKVNVAEVGQILSVKDVDEDGKPIEWEVIDAPTGSGGDGYSPIATVEQTETGATISIQDKNGTTTASIHHGEDGKNGKTPYIDEEGFVVCGENNEYPKKVFEYEWKDNYDKINVTAIDYETGILTVDSMPAQITDDVATTVRVFVTTLIDGVEKKFLYGNIPQEFYTNDFFYGVKVGENQLQLYAQNSTVISALTDSGQIDLTRLQLFVEKSRNKSIPHTRIDSLEQSHRYKAIYHLPKGAHQVAGISIYKFVAQTNVTTSYGDGYSEGYVSGVVDFFDGNTLNVFNLNTYETVSMRGVRYSLNQILYTRFPRIFTIDVYPINDKVSKADVTVGYFYPNDKTPTATSKIMYHDLKSAIYLQTPLVSIGCTTGNGNFILDGARFEVWDYGEVF